MSILKTNKALDEYTKLQERLSEDFSKLNNVKEKLSLLNRFQQGKSTIRIEREQLKIDTRNDLDDKHVALSKAVNYFNENSQYLYNESGKLIVDVGKSGLQFNIDIERAESDGIQQMKIFCYDLTLAKIWSERPVGPRFLAHDSTIFADVDERQIAKSIELATDFSSKSDFQYICCLNSDHVPWNSFSSSFKLKNHIIMELKDDPPKESLFGFRF